MKTKKALLFRTGFAAALALSLLVTGCQTTYDHYGRPVQTVDPGLAIAGIAAAGLIGYAIASDNDRHHGHGGNHYAHGGHRGHGYGYGQPCY